MQHSRRSTRCLVLAASLTASFLMPLVVMAQEIDAPSSFGADDYSAASTVVSRFSPIKKPWDITIGGGLADRPTYQGSDRHVVSPVPFVSVTYNDMISLGANGLSAYWRHDDFRIGGGLTYGAGRRDTKQSGIFVHGDDRLQGMGNINRALGVRAFAAYRLGPVVLDGSVTKLTASNNDGVFANLGMSVRYRVTDRLTLIPHAGTTWANQSYMQTHFGVTPTQAANTSFSQFNANSGLKDVGAGINGIYAFDQHWFVGAFANVIKLKGDAAKSPITFSDTNTTVMAMVGYRF